MKKYLFTGALALVVGGFFASCHDDSIEYSTIAEAKKAQFAENFENFFGKVSPNQDWGFGSRSKKARTRGTDPDANMWGGNGVQGSRYPQFSVPAPLTEEQKTVVRKWFQTHQNPNSQAVNFKNFFVQQVYKGGTKTDDGSHTTETYLAGNGQTIVSGNQMDYLMAGATSSYTAWDGSTQYNYDHMYNFNGATYSGGAKNVDVWDGDLDPDETKDFNDRKRYHSDQIQLLVNSSTSSFGYHTSQSSQQFHDKYVIIPGDWIDPIVAGMWFVGFDYEATGNNPNEYLITEDANGDITYNGKRYHKGGADGYFSDWIVRITPGDGDSNTTTIGGNTGSETTNVYKKKYVLFHKWVFCEDLGSSSQREDYDYNDLVFDAKFIMETLVVRDENGNESNYDGDNSTSYYALLTPLAAGGELAIKFERLNSNIHAMFTPEMADNILLNTARPNTTLVTPHQEGLVGNTYKLEIEGIENAITEENYRALLADINILVRTTSVAYALSAYQGEAPHKICVDPGTRWPYERTAIDIAYTGFLSYVGGGNEPWNTGVNENLYPLTDLAEKMKEDQTGKILEYELSSSSTSYSITPSATETLVWQNLDGTAYLGSDWNNQEHVIIDYNTLAQADPNNKPFGVGSVIRAYVITEYDFNVQLFTQDAAPTYAWTKLIESYYGRNDSHISNNSGYVEYTVTEADLAVLQRGCLAVSGIKATLLGVTVDNTNVAGASTGGPTFNTIGTELGDYSDSPQTNVTIDASNVNDVGAGSTFYVYGVGDGTVSASSNNTEISSARTRSAVNYFSFTVDAAQAESIRENGITFSGDNFLIYKVTISKQTYTPQNLTGDTQIWPASGTTGNTTLDWSINTLQIPKEKFAGATSTSKIKFTATRPNNQHCQIWIKRVKDQWNTEDIATVYASNDWNGSCEWTIGTNLNILQNNTISVQGANLVITKIELIP